MLKSSEMVPLAKKSKVLTDIAKVFYKLTEMSEQLSLGELLDELLDLSD